LNWSLLVKSGQDRSRKQLFLLKIVFVNLTQKTINILCNICIFVLYEKLVEGLLPPYSTSYAVSHAENLNNLKLNLGWLKKIVLYLKYTYYKNW